MDTPKIGVQSQDNETKINSLFDLQADEGNNVHHMKNIRVQEAPILVTCMDNEGSSRAHNLDNTAFEAI